MKKQLYLLLTLFITLNLSAQTYTWQWAKYGGGNAGSSSSGFSYTEDESIKDIAVDNQNNYYYLSTINPGNPTLNGTSVNLYNGQDLFLFSTDCQGNVRWTRTIGGHLSLETAWNIKLDNNGGLYILGNFINVVQTTSTAQVPIHFDDNVTIPLLTVPSSNQTSTDPGLKTAYLLKYNTSDGHLAWQLPLQGDVSWPLRNADSAIFTMDSSKNIHAILGFRAGTHLNGLITVPSTFTSTYQYYMVKFIYDNTSGLMTSQANPLLLPITGQVIIGLSEGKVNLVYDETLNRYYLAGKRMFGGSGSYADFSYAGTPFTKDGYLLAFDGNTGTEAWRKEFTPIIPNSLPDDNNVYDIVKDPNTSDIYIAGYYNVFSENIAVKFGDYTFPYITTNYNPYVMKLNSAGQVQWATIPSGLSANSTSGYNFVKGRIALNNNEIAFVKGSKGDKWGTFTMVRPQNDQADPLLVRLNKDTGAILGTNEVLSVFGTQDEFTAIAVDVDGNYVVGGFKHGSIFVDPNDGVPTVDGNTTSGKSQFFIAKLATSATCTQLATEEISVKETDMQFYPNPVEDVLNIKTKENLKTYEVISAVGQQVKRGTFKANDYTINMQGLTKGVYFVKVFTDKVSVVEKVVKK